MNRKVGSLFLFIAVISFFLLVFPDLTSAQTPLFSPQTKYGAASKNGPSGIAVGDFNGDGKADLAVVNFGDWNVYVLLGNGDGTFQAARSVYFASGGGFPWSIAAGDFNGDGKLDLVVSNYGDNSLSVLLGNGDGTFQAPLTSPVGTNPAQVTVGDFNGDGKLDLAVSSVANNTVAVLLGNGDGTFQAPQTFASAGMTHPYFVAVGDFNRDGKPDLVVSNHLCATVSVLLSNGDGTFQPAQNFAVDNDPVYVAVSDFNGDSAPDLAVANLHTLNISVLLNNTGASTVAATPTFSPGGGTYTGSVTVTISDATSGATIHYTTDGSTPTTSSAVYTGALTFTQTTTLNAMAVASGMTNSAVASGTYTIQQQQQVATPAFSPGGGAC